MIHLARIGDEDGLTQASRDNAARAWRNIASRMNRTAPHNSITRKYTRSNVTESYKTPILPRLLASRAAATFVELVEAGLAGNELYSEVWPAKRLVELAEDMETPPQEFLDKGKFYGALWKMQVIFEQLE